MARPGVCDSLGQGEAQVSAHGHGAMGIQLRTHRCRGETPKNAPIDCFKDAERHLWVEKHLPSPPSVPHSWQEQELHSL